MDAVTITEFLFGSLAHGADCLYSDLLVKTSKSGHKSCGSVSVNQNDIRFRFINNAANAVRMLVVISNSVCLSFMMDKS